MHVMHKEFKAEMRWVMPTVWKKVEVAYLHDRIPGGVDPTAPSHSSTSLKGSGISGAPLFSVLSPG